jgi:hypothetical protein
MTEALESRQLMAADFAMLSSMGAPPALIARMQGSGMDASAMISQFRSSGISPQQQWAIQQQLASNPAAKALIQQRMQAVLSRAEVVSEPAVIVQPEEVASAPIANEQPPAAASLNAPIEQESSSTVDPAPEAITNVLRIDKVTDRISDRFGGEVPEDLRERIVARRENVDGPLSRLRDRVELADINPSDFVVRDADGAIDREATRENVRESVAGSELADKIRDRVSDRFDGEIRERIAARRENADGPLSRLRDRVELADIDPSDFIVRDADGAIDREATRENVRERIAGSELADKIRDRVSDRFGGEVPAELRERIAARRESANGPLSRLRDRVELADINPSDFVVRDPDGAIDREATRENVRERVAGSERADEIRERIAARRENVDGPLSRLRDRVELADIDPSDFIVRDADSAIDREATRENVRERVAGSELTDKIRDRVSDRFGGEIPEEIQERVAERFGSTSVLATNTEPVVQLASSLGSVDVNRDGLMSALDALLVINVLSGKDSDYRETADVNGDGLVTPVDALRIINGLSKRSAATPPIASAIAEANVDRFFAGDFDDDEDDVLSLPLRSRLRLRG